LVPLHDRAELRRFLARHKLAARKGFAQHFLCSRRVVEAIAERMQGFGGILEIGPGPGVLTGPLSEAASKLIALEIDPRMSSALAESAPMAEVRLGDALKVPLDSLLAELPEPRAIVSNIPYHITGPLVTRVADARRSYELAVLMLQKEVAKRVLAKEGSPDRGSLSVFLQAQFEIERVCDVPAGAFEPPPKVDSAVLSLFPRETGLTEAEERRFFGFVRAGFSQPRKTLANNLKAAFGPSPDSPSPCRDSWSGRGRGKGWGSDSGPESTDSPDSPSPCRDSGSGRGRGKGWGSDSGQDSASESKDSPDSEPKSTDSPDSPSPYRDSGSGRGRGKGWGSDSRPESTDSPDSEPESTDSPDSPSPCRDSGSGRGRGKGWGSALVQTGLPENVRPHMLSVEQWRSLWQSVERSNNGD